MDNLSHIRSASAQANVAVPHEIVHAYVDEGEPPDAFMVKQDARARNLSEDLRCKQEAMQTLAMNVRAASERLGLLDT